MGFLAPWFLAGLAAIGLPIYFHLLKRHKSTPFKFSSLMFFERRIQSSIKHRRLRYLLLFALRTAFVVLLVLALANPFLNRKSGAVGTSQKLTVIAIDNSFSMRVDDRLAEAKREAASILGGLRAGSQAQVLAFNTSVQLMTQPTPDSAELRAAVQSIEPADSRSALAELARGLRTIAQASSIPLEVHVFSDMQKSSLPPSFGDLQLSPSTQLIPHAVGKAAPNWTVEAVSAPRRIFDPKKVKVQATIAGYGTPAASRTVSLVVNNRVLESKNVNVPGNGRATVEFLKMDAPYGFGRGEVRIDSADALAFDDSFRFGVERIDPRRILFVYESRQPRGLLYYRTAMEASTESAYVIEPVTTEQVANISPSKFALVVLSDVGTLPGTFEDALKTYVRGGGGVLIAAGPVSAARQRVPVIDAAIADVRYSPREGERFQSAGTVDATHPALRRVNKLEGVKFYQTAHLDAGKARVPATLADQTPLLLDRQVGEGRILLFASTFDNISNDFPLHASFVPFVEQAANYLAGQTERPASYVVDTFLELRSTKDQGKAVELLDPSGKRALTLAEAATAQNARLNYQGFYDVRRADGRQELAAVNTDRRESDLEILPADTLSLWQGTGQNAASANAEEQAKPWSLWWYVMLAAFLAALAEVVLGSRYLSADTEGA